MIKRTKVVKKDALNIPAKDVQKGARLITTAIFNKDMDKPFIAEVLHKLVEIEVVEEAVEYEGPSIVGTFDMAEEVDAHIHEATKEEVQPTSGVTDTVDTCIHLNFISYNFSNSSDSPFMTISPTSAPP